LFKYHIGALWRWYADQVYTGFIDLDVRRENGFAEFAVYSLPGVANSCPVLSCCDLAFDPLLKAVKVDVFYAPSAVAWCYKRVPLLCTRPAESTEALFWANRAAFARQIWKWGVDEFQAMGVIL
jgi:hypothetical protein